MPSSLALRLSDGTDHNPEGCNPDCHEATEALRELIEGKIVTLYYDAPTRRDNFGRLLARVEVDGVNVAQELMRRGLAVEWEGTERPVHRYPQGKTNR